jgi:pimeloyl-ACP methyl ester carboxylesterase
MPVKRCWTLLLLLPLVMACSDDEELPFVDSGRGSLLSDDRLEFFSKEDLAALGLPVVPDHAVALHRITYRTVDPAGNETLASGVVAIPQSPGGAVPLATYQHGSIVRKTDVASVRGSGDPEALVVMFLASKGYLAAMPDYLGLGESPGLHPYVHAASLASSVVDMLRAATKLGDRHDLAVLGDTYLVGYSEGGYATMAAQRELEGSHAQEFNIVASAPMAGPYDMSGVMSDIFESGRVYASPHYLPYTLLAYNDVYGLTDDLSEVFVAPYDESLPVLFDGTRSGAEIDREIPSAPIEMLTESFVADYRENVDNPWKRRFAENDLLDWKPTSRTRLYHCTDDEQVPYQNAVLAIESFRSQGVPESVVDLETGSFGGHGDCAPIFLLAGLYWFESVRHGTEELTVAATKRQASGWMEYRTGR